MAAESIAPAVNGNYGAHQVYAGGDTAGHAGAHAPINGPAAPSSTTTTSESNLSKDEVGWYFVEQYYTTLSKNPERLHVSLLLLLLTRPHLLTT